MHPGRHHDVPHGAGGVPGLGGQGTLCSGHHQSGHPPLSLGGGERQLRAFRPRQPHPGALAPDPVVEISFGRRTERRWRIGDQRGSPRLYPPHLHPGGGGRGGEHRRLGVPGGGVPRLCFHGRLPSPGHDHQRALHRPGAVGNGETLRGAFRRRAYRREEGCGHHRRARILRGRTAEWQNSEADLGRPEWSAPGHDGRPRVPLCPCQRRPVEGDLRPRRRGEHLQDLGEWTHLRGPDLPR